MKKIFLLAAAVVTGIVSFAQQKPDDVIKVSVEKYDFGKIKQGTPVSTYFDVVNISDKPLYIENAWAGCGCTTPEYSKEPFAPKSASKLKVGYNAAAQGHFEKDVNVKLAGINEAKVIRITGDVLDAAAWDAYTKTDEYKAAEKAKAEALTKSAKEMKKAAKGKKATAPKK